MEDAAAFREIYRPTSQAEAAVLSSVLEAAGIRFYIANENLDRMLPILNGTTLFGMRLMVETGRSEEAQELIEAVFE